MTIQGDKSELSNSLDQVFEIRNDKDGDYLQVGGVDGLDVIEIRIKDETGVTTEQMEFTRAQAKFIADSIQLLLLEDGLRSKSSEE